MDSVGDTYYQFTHHELLPKGTDFILGWPLYIHLQGGWTTDLSVHLIHQCHPSVTLPCNMQYSHSHTCAKTL